MSFILKWFKVNLFHFTLYKKCYVRNISKTISQQILKWQIITSRSKNNFTGLPKLELIITYNI